MINRQEIITDEQYDNASDEIKANIDILLDKINEIRKEYGHPMTVSSGFRSMEDHLRIYKQKGITDKSKIPMKSRHLVGLAVDIADPNQILQQWCKDNIEFLKNVGVWMEDFSATHNWAHFQVVPYGSYKDGKSLWFMP